MDPQPNEKFRYNELIELVYDFHDPAVQEETRKPLPSIEYAPDCHRDLELEEFLKSLEGLSEEEKRKQLKKIRYNELIELDYDFHDPAVQEEMLKPLVSPEGESQYRLDPWIEQFIRQQIEAREKEKNKGDANPKSEDSDEKPS